MVLHHAVPHTTRHLNAAGWLGDIIDMLQRRSRTLPATQQTCMVDSKFVRLPPHSIWAGRFRYDARAIERARTAYHYSPCYSVRDAVLRAAIIHAAYRFRVMFGRCAGYARRHIRWLATGVAAAFGV